MLSLFFTYILYWYNFVGIRVVDIEKWVLDLKILKNSEIQRRSKPQNIDYEGKDIQ